MCLVPIRLLYRYSSIFLKRAILSSIIDLRSNTRDRDIGYRIVYRSNYYIVDNNLIIGLGEDNIYR